jgi:magnesium chelatase family protein
LERYWARLSEPLLNRIDIQVQLQPLTAATLRQNPPEETSAVVQARVIAARNLQAERYAAHGGGTNASVAIPTLRQTSPLAPLVHDLLLRAMESLGLPPRAHDATWRVARTIADLDGQTDIGAEHVAEALQYRHMDAPKNS